MVRKSILVLGATLAAASLLLITAGLRQAASNGAPSEADVSALPNYNGEFVSIGADGVWHRPQPKQTLGAADMTGAIIAPEADCSQKAIVYYAGRAPAEFVKEKKGLLYGVETHTPETDVDGVPGYNSCALVVHAILKKSGCSWAKYTANAKDMYDMAYEHGWRPASSQTGGCLVAWNSAFEGKLPRIGRGEHADPKRKGGVSYRHVGITTGSWWTVDNTSYLSEPLPGLIVRPIRYDAPMFLCPVQSTPN